MKFTNNEKKAYKIILWQVAIMVNVGLLPFWTGLIFGPQWFKILWLPSMIGIFAVGYWIEKTQPILKELLEKDQCVSRAREH